MARQLSNQETIRAMTGKTGDKIVKNFGGSCNKMSNYNYEILKVNRLRPTASLVYYASDIGRWFEAEPYISKDAGWAYYYAEYVVEGRWPEAEPTITTSPRYAYHYANSIIKGRWPEAESTIMTDLEIVIFYCIDVIKGRWPEAEPYIMKDPEWADCYTKKIIKGR